MNRYTIYCTEDQTRKARELGAPIDSTRRPANHNGFLTYIEEIDCPTAEQMRGWLKTKGFKFILSDDPDCGEGNNWWVGINGELITQGYNDNKELAAIDASLEYLSNNKK